MTKKVLMLLFLCTVTFITSCREEPKKSLAPIFAFDTIQITSPDAPTLEFNVEIADTPDKQALGLMRRTTLADNAGMLFLFTPAKRTSMWMENTFLSLDMLFIDHSGVIVQIEEHTEPLSRTRISSLDKVSAVLELKAGTCERLGIKTGNKIKYPFFVVEK